MSLGHVAVMAKDLDMPGMFREEKLIPVPPALSKAAGDSILLPSAIFMVD